MGGHVDLFSVDQTIETKCVGVEGRRPGSQKAIGVFSCLSALMGDLKWAWPGGGWSVQGDQ